MNVPREIALQGLDKVAKYIGVKEQADKMELRIEKSEEKIFKGFKEMINILSSRNLWSIQHDSGRSLQYNIKNNTRDVIRELLLLEEVVKDTRKKAVELMDMKKDLGLIENELKSL